MKKNTAKTKQLPKDPKGQRFINWFAHRWNFIEADEFDTNHPKLKRKNRRQVWKEARKTASKKGKNKPNWRTETKYEIEPVVLWYRWKDPNDLVGVSFDSETKYAVSDIDRYSSIHPYNDKKAFREWLSSYEDIGLAGYVIIRSSFSEGLHIYFPLPKETGTFNLACALQICAEKAGVKVKSGELEFFPNTKNFCQYRPTPYKAHRLPLQPHTGSVILDDDLNPIGDDPKLFCDQMEWAAAKQDMDALSVACSVGREIINFRRFGSRNKTQLAKFKRDLEIMIAEGWTGKGQTNFLLGKIAAYGMIFTEHEGEDLANYIAQTAIGCDGYREYCNHQHNIEVRARDYGKSAERYYWKPGTPRKRAGTYKQNFCKSTNSNHNQEVAEKAQSRIVGGLNNLLEAGINLTVTGIEAFKKALREEIHKLHGVWVSISTLNKYKKLWHPKEKGIVLGTKVQKSETPAPEPKPEPKPEPESASVRTSHGRLKCPNAIRASRPHVFEVSSKTVSSEISHDEPKINEPVPPIEVQKNTECETPECNEIKGCTHLPPKTMKYETPECSEIKGCTHLPLYEGLYGRSPQLGEFFQYVGSVKGGLIELEGFRLPQMRTIEPNDLVKLVSTYHGSDLRDKPPLRKIVYVQLIERALQEQWKHEAGIAVFLDDLEKLKPKLNQNKIKNPKNNNNRDRQDDFQLDFKPERITKETAKHKINLSPQKPRAAEE